ncbi:MAG TPA: MerR family transcriptional regulator [Micromonosporaceae bacterium]
MELLTIGAFARLSRLSPKALRLYDELGLLPPAAVDSESGYRFYHPGQVETAQLISWLRRLGMPLARIRQLIGLPAEQAAAAVEAYRSELAAEAAAREQLATFLIDHLSGRGATMSSAQIDLGIRYAARTDIGKVRTSNQDVAYAGEHLLAVADGVGAAAGARASQAAVAALRPVAAQAVPLGDLRGTLADAVAAAEEAVRTVAESTEDGEAVTTLTAMLWSGVRLGLLHIGDSRAYLWRDATLSQLTHDHTYVQSLVDEGQLTQAEAATHPQQTLLVRALTGTRAYHPDLWVQDAAAGDRYLLCTDGLSRFVAADALGSVLGRDAAPADLVDDLIGLAHQAGAPDNVACVVADLVAL